ncbi:MAG: VanZ family protein [Myxococcota bacterium]|nr:VanZ family protein [Myxococcota bacterium]
MKAGAVRLVTAVARGLSALPQSAAIAATLIWMAGIFALSSGTPRLLPEGWLSSLVHNAGHAVIFGVLALLAARALGTGPRAQWAGFAIAVLYGATDEWHQSHVPGRTASIADWVTDAIGAAAALWVVAAVPVDAKVRHRLLVAGAAALVAASVATLFDQISAA